MSDPVWPHRWQPTRLPRPWDSPGKNTGVGCHFLLQWIKWKVKVKSLSRVQLLATPWTAAYQAPQPMGFSRQEYWSGVPLPSPRRNKTWIAMSMPSTRSSFLNKYPLRRNSWNQGWGKKSKKWLKHLVSESKKVLKDWWIHVKRTQKTVSLRGSEWPNLRKSEHHNK